MSRVVKLFFCLLILSAAFIPHAAASTVAAAGCSRNAVGNAVTQAIDGDTVVIPACPPTNWTTTLTVTKCINIQGAGQVATTLGDNVTKDGSDTSQLINFNVNCPTGNISLSNLGIVGVAPDAAVFNKGHIRIQGTMAFFHINHITTTTPQTTFATVESPSPGLFDHLTFPNCQPSENGGLNFKASGFGGVSFGDGSWSAPVTPGDSHQIYIEDSTWSCLDPTFVMNAVDGDAGSRFVFRFNTLTGASTGSHGTDSSQRERSVRWMEIYKNTFTYPPTQAPDLVNWTRGGSSIVWGNTVSSPSGLNFIVKTENLRDSAAFTPWGQCDGTSVYDQNTGGEAGYRCVDQPGSGTSNALSGNPASPAAWVGNILYPIYIYLNTLNGSETDTASGSSGNHVRANRDYYVYQTAGCSGTQTTGVCSGPLANRAGSCTTGVAYWATDQGFWNTKTPGVAAGQLYKCTSTNNWTLYYTPFTYPHPQTIPPGSGPNPPTNLRATVH